MSNLHAMLYIDSKNVYLKIQLKIEVFIFIHILCEG